MSLREFPSEGYSSFLGGRRIMGNGIIIIIGPNFLKFIDIIIGDDVSHIIRIRDIGDDKIFMNSQPWTQYSFDCIFWLSML
jgi:hypothetical protein